MDLKKQGNRQQERSERAYYKSFIPSEPPVPLLGGVRGGLGWLGVGSLRCANVPHSLAVE